MGAMVPDPLSLSEIALYVPSVEPVAAAAAYTVLLGPPATGSVCWAAGNGSVTIQEADDPVPPWTAFRAADPVAAGNLLARRGRSVDEATRRLASVAAIGITAETGARAGAPELDHVVFTAPSVDAAVALFGGCLGLDFRLVREFGPVTQVFFRTRSLVVEVLVGRDDPVPAEVALWGVAWRCADLDAEHARLGQAGLELSEIRPGRKPRTRVVTVREKSLGTPTLLIEQHPR